MTTATAEFPRVVAATRIFDTMSCEDGIDAIARLVAAGRVTTDEVRELVEAGRRDADRRYRDYAAGAEAGRGWADLAASDEAALRVTRLHVDDWTRATFNAVERVATVLLGGSGNAREVWGMIAGCDDLPSEPFAFGFVAGVRQASAVTR